MESPVQTEDTRRERSRNPSPDTDQPVSPSEDGLERIADLDELDRYDALLDKARARPLTCDDLLVTCKSREQEAEAYHRETGACLSIQQRVDRAEDGGGLRHPGETQADEPVAVPLETLVRAGDDDPGLGVLEGHMDHATSAEAAKEEYKRYAAMSPGGKVEAMSELLSDKQTEDRAKQSPHKRHEPTPRERDRDRSTSATPLLTPSVPSAADQGMISPLSINNPLVHKDDPPPRSLAVDMGMDQNTLHRQQHEGGTPEYLRFQKGPNVGYETRKERERADEQQQQQQLHPSTRPRHSLSPQQSWESEMYADAGETGNECILSGSDASVPLFSISTEGTIFSQEDDTPTQLTPQQSRDAGVMTASLKCISPEIRQQLQDDFVVDRKLMRLLTQPCGETSGIPGGDTHLTEDTRAQMRIDVWNTICSSKPNGDLLHLKLMAPGRSREDLINRGNRCMEEIIIHDTDPTADGFSQLVWGEDSPLLTEPIPAVPSEVWRRMLQQVKVKDSADYGMKYRLVDLQRMHRRGQQRESEKTEYQVVEMPASMLSAGYGKRDEYLEFLPEEAYDLMRKNQRMVRKGKREEEVDWRAYVARQGGSAIGICVTGTQGRLIPTGGVHTCC